MTSGGNNFNHFAENQLTKFSARDAGDFSDAAGEREMTPKCGSLPRDAGDLVGLEYLLRWRKFSRLDTLVSVSYTVLTMSPGILCHILYS